MRRCRKGLMQACLLMRTFLHLHRAQAHSEKERSGFELSMAQESNRAVGPQREEAKRLRAEHGARVE